MEEEMDENMARIILTTTWNDDSDGNGQERKDKQKRRDEKSVIVKWDF